MSFPTRLNHNQNLFLIVSYCFCSFGEFAKAGLTRTSGSLQRVHFQVGDFRLSTNLDKAYVAADSFPFPDGYRTSERKAGERRSTPGVSAVKKKWGEVGRGNEQEVGRGGEKRNRLQSITNFLPNSVRPRSAI